MYAFAARRLAGATIACLVLLAAAPAQAQNFSLPSLPYSTLDFEPSIDNVTMDYHWNRHANAFVNNLNTQLNTNCTELQGKGLLELVEAVGSFHRCSSRELKIADILKITVRGKKRCPNLPAQCATLFRNNAGGLWNHGLFFLHNLAPYKSQSYDADASSDLKAAVERDFGGEEELRAAFSAAATSVFGSGWAWLVADPDTKQLSITTTGNQDNPLMTLPEPSTGAPVTIKGLPILGLDVWEHAYYLKYQNLRANYITAFWDVINWKGVSDLYTAAWFGNYGEVDVLTPAANWQT